LKNTYNIICEQARQPRVQCRKAVPEESPSSIGQDSG